MYVFIKLFKFLYSLTMIISAYFTEVAYKLGLYWIIYSYSIQAE